MAVAPANLVHYETRAQGFAGMAGVARIAQRTPGISVRMSLGTGRRRILVWLMGEAGVLVAMVAMLGLAGSLGLSRHLTSLLFQVKPTDPATYVTVGIGLPLVALAASFLTARRATLIDAVGALRQG